MRDAARHYLDMISETIGARLLCRQKNCNEVCAPTDWAVNAPEGRRSCLKCFQTYNPGSVDNVDAATNTFGQEVMPIRQDANVPVVCA